MDVAVWNILSWQSPLKILVFVWNIHILLFIFYIKHENKYQLTPINNVVIVIMMIAFIAMMMVITIVIIFMMMLMMTTTTRLW